MRYRYGSLLEAIVLGFGFVLVLSLPAASFGQGNSGMEAGYTSLFNGQSLEGWEGDHSLFRVVDGSIVAGTLDSAIKSNAFLCTTQEYSDFELRLKAKLVGPGDNAGIQFRSKRVPDHHEVSGYQADMGTVSRSWFNDVIGVTEDDVPSGAKSPVWGSLYDESRRNGYLAWALPSDVTPILNVNDWNDLVVRATGERIQIMLNGSTTVDFIEKSHIPQSGVICLQVHSGAPTEAWHREIYLKVM